MIFFKMENVDLWVTLNDLKGQMEIELTYRWFSLFDLTNFVKNCELI